MSTTQATAEVLWTAFIAMDEDGRRAFLERLVADPQLRENLVEAAILEDRRGEPSTPLQDVLEQLGRTPVGDRLSEEEVVTLVHEVRERSR